MLERPWLLLRLLSFVLLFLEGRFVSAVPHGAQSSRTFLQVGHSGLRGNQSSTFHILLDTIKRLSFNLTFLKSSKVLDYYFTWCSSVGRCEKWNLIKFNNLRQPNVQKLWGLNALFKVLMYCVWILAMPEFNFVRILSTCCDILFSPYFISKGTTVSYAHFLFILEMSNKISFQKLKPA